MTCACTLKQSMWHWWTEQNTQPQPSSLKIIDDSSTQIIRSALRIWWLAYQINLSRPHRTCARQYYKTKPVTPTQHTYTPILQDIDCHVCTAHTHANTTGQSLSRRTAHVHANTTGHSLSRPHSTCARQYYRGSQVGRPTITLRLDKPHLQYNRKNPVTPHSTCARQ